MYYNKDSKYPDLESLVKAYKSGELSQEDALDIDNDVISLYVQNPDDEDDFIEVFCFDAPGDSGLLQDALKLLGIPSQEV